MENKDNHFLGLRTVGYAVNELGKARDWYAERSTIAAVGFLEELELAIRAISLAPDLYPEYVDGTRRYVFPRFPFNLVYRVGAESILIIAVSHQRREPRYWASRAE